MRILITPMAGALLGLALLAGPAHAGAPLALTAPLLLVDDDDDDDDDGRRRWVRPRHVERHRLPGHARAIITTAMTTMTTIAAAIAAGAIAARRSDDDDEGDD